MTTWQSIADAARQRIRDRQWPPGDRIPNEAALAEEFGCARATVNRALQALADDGWLERRRKAGTRVALSPQRRAQLSIPVLRQEVEDSGRSYRHILLDRTTASGGDPRARGFAADADLLALRTLHLADDIPFAIEDRLVDTVAAPGLVTADLSAISVNEWLVRNAPFARGTLRYGAITADAALARHLDCAQGTALMHLTRRTWSDTRLITDVTLTFAEGYALTFEI